MLREGVEDFRKDRASAAIFLKADGAAWSPGETLVQKDLADTLRAISERGTDGFYKGRVAAALVAASRAGNGIIVQADLDKYQTRELAPIECDYRSLRVISAPPSSSGGVTLCQMLHVLEGYPLRELGFGSAQALHYEIEAMRRALRRSQLLSRRSGVRRRIRSTQLLDRRYAERIRASIDPKRAGASSKISPGIASHEGAHTTHYSIADKSGNAVAVTYTLNDWFGARVTAGGTGVLLNNEMDDFTAKPGVPNMYGLVQGDANRIEPGKRPLSSMTPTIVSRRRQASDDRRHARRQPHHHRRPAHDTQRHRLRHGHSGSGRCAALSPAMAARSDECREVHAEPGYASHPGRAWGTSSPNRSRTITSQRFSSGRPALRAQPVGKNRFYGAIDPRRNTGLAMGY